jgi:hypothetical protein
MYCVVRFAQAVVISSAHAGLKKTVLRVLSAQVLFISSAHAGFKNKIFPCYVCTARQ